MSDTGVQSGHGTYVDKEDVIASVVGTVERVNKLVTVRAIRTRWVVFKFSGTPQFSPDQDTIQRWEILSLGA
jgi:hypothetical protein